jgi:phosphate uptake regulator
MKRKIIRSGPSTLVVSLPSKWVKEYRLKPGSELEVVQNANVLNLVVGDIKSDKKVMLDVNTPELMRRIGAAYKAGYDLVKISFETSKELDKIIGIMSDGAMIGYEIAEQSNKEVIIKEVSQLDIEHFNTMLRRTFHTLLSMNHELYLALRADDKDSFRKIINMDTLVNKATNFCRRALNKGIITDFNKNAPLYYVCEQLERIGDSLKSISAFLISGNFIAYEKFLEDIMNSFSASRQTLSARSRFQGIS